MQDDLYSGYNDGSNVLAGSTGPSAQALGSPGASPLPTTGMRTAARPPGSAFRLATGAPGSAMRLGTGAPDPDARPMTSNKGAGYSSSPVGRKGAGYDTGANLGSSGLPERPEASMEEKCRDKEKEVHAVLESSAAAAARGDTTTALARAKEAAKKERALSRLREEHSFGDQTNVDLTYAVLFNWAAMQCANGNLSEALSLYEQIVKNKDFHAGGRLRVNMGNIYYEQKQYPNAIKMYRMALDQIQGAGLRSKVLRNIGAAFVKMGSYRDARETLEKALQQQPDHRIGLNLVVCEYALGDVDKMKAAFHRLLELPAFNGEAALDVDGGEDDDSGDAQDGLKEELRSRQSALHNSILLAARLVAPCLGADISSGYGWCVEQLMNAGHSQLANSLELSKASMCLKQNDFGTAIKVFKGFEKKEPAYTARAATNLSFLYILENNTKGAAVYADMAVRHDAYNARAKVNMGNILFDQGHREDAAAKYAEALSVEADCVEAMYNQGLAAKSQEQWEGALAAFEKLRNILPLDVEVIYQIAHLHSILGQAGHAPPPAKPTTAAARAQQAEAAARQRHMEAAVEMYEYLHTLVPNDPGVLAALGNIHDAQQDESKALHYYAESHRVYPVDIQVISWLGAFHVKHEAYDAAVPYFELAARVQPKEFKWLLMVASCFRRLGLLSQALLRYRSLHSQQPENIECLRYLIHVCTELGHRDEVNEYATKLRKAERQAEHTQVIMAGGSVPTPEPAFESPGVGGLKARTVVGRQDDEWGDEELGDDLLPGS